MPDFTPFLQRVKDKKPDVLFIFVPGGAHTSAVVKAYGAMGLRDAGIRLVGPGDLTQDNKLQDLGAAAVGMVTMHHYNADLDNPYNKAFVAAYKKAHGEKEMPDFTAVGGYDGMAAIYKALAKTNGNSDGDALVGAMRGLAWESPRGPISIDPDTRDIVQNIYVRRVERVGGELFNVEFATYEAVKDPLKVRN